MSQADFLSRIFDEVLHPPLVDAAELKELNAEYGFDDTDPHALLMHQQEIREKRGVDATDDTYRWLEAFSRYRLSDQWQERLSDWQKQNKSIAADMTEEQGRQVKVAKEVETARSTVPVPGSVGVITGCKFLFDEYKPEEAGFYYRVQFELPCMLVGGTLYVNEAIVPSEASEPYMKKHNVTSLMWHYDGYNFFDAYFKAEEIEFI